MNVTNNMAPYDGSGYGHSIYWRNKMKEIAQEKKETCSCWSKDEPAINFCGERDQFEMTISCKEKTSECVKSFPETQAELVNKFKIFYKV
jgi:hypothetical protein